MKKYIPNLIPQQHKVLPEYFKEPPRKTKSNAWDSILIILAIVLFVAGLGVIIISFWFAICLFLTSFIILPWGHRFLEKALQFKFPSMLRLKALGLISVFSIFTGSGYLHKIDEIQKQHQIVEQKELVVQKQNQQLERNRKDSLEFYITQAEKYQKTKDFKKAIKSFEASQKFAHYGEDERIKLGLANTYFAAQDYSKATAQYNAITSTDADIYFKKGICAKKLGDTKNAIINFKSASDLGNEKAAKEYDKVNPLMRRVVEYRTLCCDGTYSPSNAKGRGACSHHGGVCNWNDPLYEEYRKYEISDF